ncbi:hypothetical protein [Pseudomonas thivervalensis]|uniref:hypothetical protein n=1 Tax=Pseudomonas thivervalensis TaxID=86265 RepID=UPI003D97E123
MSRLAPLTSTLRALFARSGNRCAFPGCTAHLINEKNQFVAQVCHIEAAEVGGERYNSKQSDEQRRHYDNLILLCYPHHIETDDTYLYPPSRLVDFKLRHEASHTQNPFKIDESLLFKVKHEMEEYWRKIEHAHRDRHVISDLAIPVDAHITYLDLVQEAYCLIERLLQYSAAIEEADNKLQTRIPEFIVNINSGCLSDDDYNNRLFSLANHNWELLNLGMNNALYELRVRLVQMEIRFLEEYLKINGTDNVSRVRLDALKSEFEKIATQAGYVD